MDKMWLKYVYNVEKHDADELKTALHLVYNFTIAITRVYFAICKVRSKNSNSDLIWPFLWFTFYKPTSETSVSECIN